MRKISADFILNPAGNLVANHTLVVNDDGSIIDLVPGRDSDVTLFSGLLTPGFINTHCHLELSNLKAKIAPGNGIQEFLRDIIKVRNDNSTELHSKIISADKLMWENGIQAVGDICNTEISFDTKQHSKIRYYSFVELFNFNSSETESVYFAGEKKYNSAIQSHKYASIVPHAPYSVTPQLFEMIKAKNMNWCIHNQESLAENELFLTGIGLLSDLFSSMKINMKWFTPTGKNSLQSIANYFPETSKLLFVHNTFTKEKDIEFLKSKDYFNRSWFSICAKANLYIEKQLPSLSMFWKENCKLTIGTDSLASNDTLSVLEELKIIHNHFKNIPIEELLKWATSNGASYFGWNDLGSFNKNTRPGILWISDANEQEIKSESTVLRIA